MSLGKYSVFVIGLISLFSSFAFAIDPSIDLQNARNLYEKVKAGVEAQPADQSNLDDKQKKINQKQRERLAALEDTIKERERSEKIPVNERTFKQVDDGRHEQPQKVKWAPKEYAEDRWVLMKGSGSTADRMFKILKRLPNGRLRLTDREEVFDAYPENMELPVNEANGIKPGDWIYSKATQRVRVLDVFPDGTVRTDAKGQRGVLSGRDSLNGWRLNKGEYEPSPDIFDKVRKIFSGKFSGALSVAPIVSGAIRGVVEEKVEASMNAGTCPLVSTSTLSSYDLAFTKDFSVLEPSAEDCRKIGKPYDFSQHLDEVKNDKLAGFSQVSCSDQGDLTIVFKNGYTSKVQFSASNRIGSIVTRKSDVSAAPSIEYVNSLGAWSVQTNVVDHGKPVSRKETFASFFNRSYCMKTVCSPAEIQSLISPQDDSTSKDNPYGNLGENDFSRVSASFFSTKRALLTSFLKSGNYAETCKTLGARTQPTTNVTFSSPTDSRPAESTNRSIGVPGPKPILVK